ncbi:hypothetical protein Cgig2_018736 [Carnegiea gigantea]|uniref:DNA-directed RNA polymerase n=1 Tax=Carnegiea gigantea TaxID=171969 RepID=A0A9Q1GTQ4_9CARY|nr:hypothetical protein Cgig2_018736 [Carnegiea gigantea]
MADMEASVEDKSQLVREFTKVRGLVKEQLHSYNHFLTTEIRNTVRMNNEIRSRVDPEIYLRFKDVKVGEPSIMIDGIRRKLFPQSCRLTGMTYAAPIEARIQYVCKCNGEKKIFERVRMGNYADFSIPRINAFTIAYLFIVHMRQKDVVILIPERLSDNRVFTDIDNKGK